MLDTTLFYTPIKESLPTSTLVSYTLPWPNTPLLNFLNLGRNAPRVYWENDSLSLTFAGFGAAAMLTAHGPNRFQAIQQKTDQLFKDAIIINHDAPGQIKPRLFGGFAFQPNANSHGIWSAFPSAAFMLPRYQLTQLNGQCWLTINRQITPGDDPLNAYQQFQQETNRLKAALAAPAVPVSPSLTFQSQDVMAHQTWNTLVVEATTRIRRGELDKVVLARARRILADGPISPVQVLTGLADCYPDCYRFLFEPVPGHAFYGATPELLAQVNGAKLRTVAMAGSIARGDTPETDDALAHELLSNPKEQHEHALVVEAIKENLQTLATDLQIPAAPTIHRLSNIQHLKTSIHGQLNNNCGILPVVEVLHPTPAVGGRPRQLALEIINHVEPTPRGWYAAPVGWLDPGGNGMFAVAIRSAVSLGSESMLFAGAGIVADSIPDKEWRETELKFRPLARALTGTG